MNPNQQQQPQQPFTLVSFSYTNMADDYCPPLVIFEYNDHGDKDDNDDSFHDNTNGQDQEQEQKHHRKDCSIKHNALSSPGISTMASHYHSITLDMTGVAQQEDVSVSIQVLPARIDQQRLLSSTTSVSLLPSTKTTTRGPILSIHGFQTSRKNGKIIKYPFYQRYIINETVIDSSRLETQWVRQGSHHPRLIISAPKQQKQHPFPFPFLSPTTTTGRSDHSVVVQKILGWVQSHLVGRKLPLPYTTTSFVLPARHSNCCHTTHQAQPASQRKTTKKHNSSSSWNNNFARMLPILRH